MGKQYDLEDRLLEFAARIIRLVEKLPDTRAGNHVAAQLLRFGYLAAAQPWRGTSCGVSEGLRTQTKDLPQGTS